LASASKRKSRAPQGKEIGRGLEALNRAVAPRLEKISQDVLRVISVIRELVEIGG
jgi:hypothetical protein